MAVRNVAKGLISFAFPQVVRPRRTGGSNSARYCYSVFLRHLKAVHHILRRVPQGVVAEIGPGDSLGVGIAALLAGASQYRAYDIVAFAAREQNLLIFDALLDLFKKRTPIPDEGEFSNLKPVIDDYSFPHALLPKHVLERSLAPERLAALRHEIEQGILNGSKAICYRAPWNGEDDAESSSVDWIFSQAVMGQIDNLVGIYRACGRWLSLGGTMSHQIDFGCLGTADTWDGHRAYSPLMWKIVRGRRAFLINRLPPSRHRELLQENGLAIRGEIITREVPHITSPKLALPFRDWSDDDLSAKSIFQVSEKIVRDRKADVAK